MMDTFNGALTLNQTLLLGMRESPYVVRRGLLVVLLVGLLVGGVQGISSMITASSPDRIVAEFEAGFDQSVRQQALSANTPEQREVIRIINANKESLLNLVRTLVELPTPLPRPVGVVLQGLGQMASTPLTYLGGLVFAVVLTQIAARQLGGQGSIQQMLGLGALSVAPHALDALSFVPGLGPALSLIAWFWGLVVLVVATSVAHRLDSGRATLAVLLYPLIGMFLFGLGCCALFLFILLGARG